MDRRSQRGRRNRTPPFADEDDQQQQSRNLDSRPLRKRSLKSGGKNVVSKTPSPPTFSPVFDDQPPPAQFLMPPLTLKPASFFTRKNRTTEKVAPDFDVSQYMARTEVLDEEDDEEDLDLGRDIFDAQPQRQQGTEDDTTISSIPSPKPVKRRIIVDDEDYSGPPIHSASVSLAVIADMEIRSRELRQRQALEARRGPPMPAYMAGHERKMGVNQMGGPFPIFGSTNYIGGYANGASSMHHFGFGGRGRGSERGSGCGYGRGSGSGRGSGRGRGRGVEMDLLEQKDTELRQRIENLQNPASNAGRGFGSRSHGGRGAAPESGRGSGRGLGRGVGSPVANAQGGGRGAPKPFKAVYFFAEIDKEQPVVKTFPLTDNSTLLSIPRSLPMIFYKKNDSYLVHADENGINANYAGFSGPYDAAGKVVLKNGKMGILKFPPGSSFHSPRLTNTFLKFVKFANGRLMGSLHDDDVQERFRNHVRMDNAVTRAIYDGALGNATRAALPNSPVKFSLFIAKDASVVEPSGYDVIMASTDAGYTKLLELFSDAYGENFNGMVFIHHCGVLPYGLPGSTFYPCASSVNKSSFQSLSCARSLPYFVSTNHRQSAVTEAHGSKNEHIKLHSKTPNHGAFFRRVSANPVLTILVQPVGLEATRVSSSSLWMFVERRTRDLGEPLAAVADDAPSW